MLKNEVGPEMSDKSEVFGRCANSSIYRPVNGRTAMCSRLFQTCKRNLVTNRKQSESFELKQAVKMNCMVEIVNAFDFTDSVEVSSRLAASAVWCRRVGSITMLWAILVTYRKWPFLIPKRANQDWPS
jgi:hypothetical protein